MNVFDLTIAAVSLLLIKMLSLEQCKTILNKNKKSKKYTDEEVAKIRDWIDHFAETTLSFLENKTEEEIKNLQLKIHHE